MQTAIKYVIALSGALTLSNASAFAAEAPIELTTCTESLGTIAVVEGDTQGWTKYGLASPRELIASLVSHSGCFTQHNGDASVPAKFLMNVIAGDKEEVDQGMSMAKSVATEGLIRSGAAGSLLTRVPFGGSALGMLGGLGGKKKTVAAGIRMISPANGVTLVSGSGEVKKSTLTFGGSDGWAQGANATGYSNTSNGKMLTEAFILAFNSVVAQKTALASVPNPAGASSVANNVVAVDTKMFTSPIKTAAITRSLRAGTTLKPTGKREGLFIEAEDNFGTKGWVSVEDLK